MYLKVQTIILKKCNKKILNEEQKYIYNVDAAVWIDRDSVGRKRSIHQIEWRWCVSTQPPPPPPPPFVLLQHFPLEPNSWFGAPTFNSICNPIMTHARFLLSIFSIFLFHLCVPVDFKSAVMFTFRCELRNSIDRRCQCSGGSQAQASVTYGFLI